MKTFLLLGNLFLKLENIYNYKTASISASFKDADSKKGIVTGYFSAFNNKDSDGDIIVKGAFARTIGKHGPNSDNPRIKHLLNHDTTKPLGKLLLLQEDDKGLYYESQTGTHLLGKDFLKMVESGLITEHSIGFRTITKEDSKEGTLLKELHLWEGSSLTSWGANDQTPLAGLKSLSRDAQVDSLIKKQKAIETFCRNSDASDEALEALIIYNKQLSQLIINQTTDSTNSAKATSSDDDDDEMIDIKTSIFLRLNHLTNGTRRNKEIAKSD